MIRRSLLAFLAAVCLGLATAGLLATGASAATKPSFVVIQTDDQPLNQFDRRFRDLYDNWRQIMPKTMALMRDKGITFTQYLTPFPLCAPSRASLLSGRYTQNHGVVRIGGARGGWTAWQNNPIMYENLPVWLQRAGYQTLHFGKFMNFYGGPDGPPETIVPPGGDRWVPVGRNGHTGAHRSAPLQGRWRARACHCARDLPSRDDARCRRTGTERPAPDITRRWQDRRVVGAGLHALAGRLAAVSSALRPLELVILGRFVPNAPHGCRRRAPGHRSALDRRLAGASHDRPSGSGGSWRHGRQGVAVGAAGRGRRGSGDEVVTRAAAIGISRDRLAAMIVARSGGLAGTDGYQ